MAICDIVDIIKKMINIPKVVADNFEPLLINYIEKFMICPTLPDNVDQYKISNGEEISKLLCKKMDDMHGRGLGRKDRINGVINIYNYIYANKDNLVLRGSNFTEICKNKLVEFYFTTVMDTYAKKYIKMFSKVYFEAIFGQNLHDYIVESYLDADIDQELRSSIAHYMRFNNIGEHIDEQISNHENRFLTWEQAGVLHSKIMRTINARYIYTPQEYALKIEEYFYDTISKITSKTYYEYNVDCLLELTSSFKNSYPSHFSKYCYSDNAKNMKVHLISNCYSMAESDKDTLWKFYWDMFGKLKDVNSANDIMWYFMKNKKKFDEKVIQNMEKHIFDTIVTKLLKNHKNNDSDMSPIKIKLFYDYHYGSDIDKESCQIYSNALFNKDIGTYMSNDMMAYFILNKDKYNEEECKKITEHIIASAELLL